MTTDSFSAERQPNGDVWISSGMCVNIFIPKEHCAELAKLLMGPVVSESHKVDYALSVDEPE